MKLGRVIGRVVCTQKMECFDGLKLLLVQPVDENGKWRPSTLLVLGCALLLAFAGVFVYFSIGGHR